MARTEGRARTSTSPGPDSGRSWVVSGLIAGMIGLALWGFTPLIDGIAWWVQSLLAGVAVLLAAATVRSLARRRFWGTLAGAGAGIALLTATFGDGTGLLAIIPTPDTLAVFAELDRAGNRDIVEQSIPADATEGIRFLLCIGVVAIAVAADGVAHLLRAPALAGIPVLILLLVPSFVRADFLDLPLFALTSATWLALIVVQSRPAARRTAVGVGAAAVLVALIAPAVLPEVRTPAPAEGLNGSLATGLNPIITLGDDLRRGNPRHALTYRTSDDSEQYLRLTVLDDFTGESWVPSTLPEPGRGVDEIGPVPGLEAGVPAPTVTATIVVGDVASRWLPVPYAPSAIRGLEGTWSWEPDGLTVRTERSNAQGQGYEVDAVQPAPSVEQLVAAGSGPVPGMDRYLQLPPELPDSVATTALEVTAGLASNYDRALALQQFFRSGDFVYSEQAPVDDDYDGSGAEVLGVFLEARSGYCVHFSSAMAAMARTLGIPSRVVVGFAPGSTVKEGEDDTIVHRVTTHDLHAWPELYFENIGWVRFEPTPGRGTPPAFAPLDEDDPSTPDVDESVPPPPTPAPTSSATPTAAPDVPDDEPTAAPDAAEEGTDAPARGIPVGAVVSALVLALLLTPAVARALRRARRLRAVGRGSALDGWDELRDTAFDLGLSSDVGLTPRQLAESVDALLDDASAAALARLRSALESQAFDRVPERPDPADVSLVVRGLRRGAGLGPAVASVLLPRSLVRSWLPTPAARD
ncbi:transglutaminase family protein [Schumannella luteola]